MGWGSMQGAITSLKNNRRRYQHSFKDRKTEGFNKNYTLNFRSLSDEERAAMHIAIEKRKRIMRIRSALILLLTTVLTIGFGFWLINTF